MTMPLAQLSIESVGPVVVARIEGEIDMSNAADLGTTISRGVPNEAVALVLELSGVGYVDSAGIQVLFELHERLETRGQRLRVVVPQDAPITEALRLADVPTVIGSAETLDGALRSVGD